VGQALNHYSDKGIDDLQFFSVNCTHYVSRFSNHLLYMKSLKNF